MTPARTFQGESQMQSQTITFVFLTSHESHERVQASQSISPCHLICQIKSYFNSFILLISLKMVLIKFIQISLLGNLIGFYLK